MYAGRYRQLDSIGLDCPGPLNWSWWKRNNISHWHNQELCFSWKIADGVFYVTFSFQTGPDLASGPYVWHRWARARRRFHLEPVRKEMWRCVLPGTIRGQVSPLMSQVCRTGRHCGNGGNVNWEPWERMGGVVGKCSIVPAGRWGEWVRVMLAVLTSVQPNILSGRAGDNVLWCRNNGGWRTGTTSLFETIRQTQVETPAESGGPDVNSQRNPRSVWKNVLADISCHWKTDSGFSFPVFNLPLCKHFHETEAVEWREVSPPPHPPSSCRVPRREFQQSHDKWTPGGAIVCLLVRMLADACLWIFQVRIKLHRWAQTSATASIQLIQLVLEQ